MAQASLSSAAGAASGATARIQSALKKSTTTAARIGSGARCPVGRARGGRAAMRVIRDPTEGSIDMSGSIDVEYADALRREVVERDTAESLRKTIAVRENIHSFSQFFARASFFQRDLFHPTATVRQMTERHRRRRSPVRRFAGRERDFAYHQTSSFVRSFVPSFGCFPRDTNSSRHIPSLPFPTPVWFVKHIRPWAVSWSRTRLRL